MSTAALHVHGDGGGTRVAAASRRERPGRAGVVFDDFLGKSVFNWVPKVR